MFGRNVYNGCPGVGSAVLARRHGLRVPTTTRTTIQIPTTTVPESECERKEPLSETTTTISFGGSESFER